MKTIFLFLIVGMLPSLSNAESIDIVGGNGGNKLNPQLIIDPKPLSGKITADTNIDCSGDANTTSTKCDTTAYATGASVTLTATPNTQGATIAWGGDCSGNLSTCSLTMTAAKTVTVTFTAVATPVINVPSATPIAITQVSSQDTIAFGEQSAKTTTTLTVSNTVANSTLQNISVAVNGTGFSKTTTDTCSGQSVNNCTVEIAFDPTNLPSLATGSITISATNVTTGKTINLSGSKKADTYSLTVNQPANGTISCTSNGSPCLTTGIVAGTPVTLTATSSDSTKFEFANWLVDACASNTTASCNLTINANTTVGATFKEKTVPKAVLKIVEPSSLSISFAETEIGQTSTEQTVTISNAGDAELTNLTIGEVPAGFTKLTTCGTTLAKAGICTVAVKFTPQTGQTGTITGVLKITSTDNPNGFSINLSGTVKSITSPSACNENSLSVCNQTDCETKTNGKGLWNTATQTPICIAKPDLKQLSALAINVKAGVLETPKAMLFGGARKGNTISQGEFLIGETVSIDGFIVPETAHLNQDVDILVLGRYLAALPTGKTEDDCDPQFGDYYVNIGNGNYRDNYCVLDLIGTFQKHLTDTIQQHGNALFEELCKSANKTWKPAEKTCGDETTQTALDITKSTWLPESYCTRINGTWNATTKSCDNLCNASRNDVVSNPLLPTTRRSINAESYWARWNGKLDGLKALARGKLSERTELRGLYMDTLNYTGHVCINFGYRLDDGKIIFNGEPVKYRVSP